jgi:DNA (cytosine-5)-methyltransferase 1
MTIRIGTDCSGIEAPIQALKKLKIKFSHEWSCEIDSHARESIKANYNPKIVFKDITTKRKLPDIDLYVAGFPCQTFSNAGNRDGFNDPRGTIFFECYKVIKKKKPKYFLLENVKGLVAHNNGKTFNVIKDYLRKFKMYDIHYKVLNTRHYGIPQNRERVFIIGVPKDHPFEWPKPVKCKDIMKFIDRSVTKKDIPPDYASAALKKTKGTFVDLGWVNITSPLAYRFYTPTILACSRIWCKPMKRYATIKELLSLQGFPKNFKQVVSEHQLKKQIGNSMSVNVIAKIFKEMFKT